MRLQPRLKALYDLITPCDVLADIGCDHALLPIALIEGNKCKKAYACDINELPLKRGYEAIKQAKLETKIIPMLTDGIQGLSDDVDSIVIAGMGYETITHILSANLKQAHQYQQIILQCNNHVDLLREWLANNQFKIINETLAKDGNHYYQMIVCRYGEMTLNKKEQMFGFYLYDHPLFREYWMLQKKKKQMILDQMQPHHQTYNQIKEEIVSINALFEKE